MAQKEFDELLTKIADKAGEDLESIIIFDLKDGFPLGCNSQLKERNEDFHYALFPDENEDEDIDIKPFKVFKTFEEIQKSLDEFGQTTNKGDLVQTIFKLEEGIMVVYFEELPDLPIAICFTSPSETRLSTITTLARVNIKQIIKELKKTFG